jgi:O-antigen ligase
MQRMTEERVPPAAGADGRHRIRPLALTVLLLAGFIGVLLFLALVVAPWAGAAGGCGGG